MAAGQVQTVVDERRMRFGLVVCGTCSALICEGPYCTSCGKVLDRQAVIDMLIELKIRRPDPPMAA